MTTEVARKKNKNVRRTVLWYLCWFLRSIYMVLGVKDGFHVKQQRRQAQTASDQQQQNGFNHKLDTLRCGFNHMNAVARILPLLFQVPRITLIRAVVAELRLRKTDVWVMIAFIPIHP